MRIWLKARKYDQKRVFTEATAIFYTTCLHGLPVPGFKSRESEKFTGIS